MDYRCWFCVVPCLDQTLFCLARYVKEVGRQPAFSIRAPPSHLRRNSQLFDPVVLSVTGRASEYEMHLVIVWNGFQVMLKVVIYLLDVLQKEALMEQVAHQAVVMQFILEMARNAQQDPRGCFRQFFQKAKVSMHSNSLAAVHCNAAEMVHCIVGYTSGFYAQCNVLLLPRMLMCLTDIVFMSAVIPSAFWI